MPWTKIAVDNAVEDLSQGQPPKGARPLSYAEALREALFQALKKDANVFVMGEGVDDPGGVFGSTLNLHKEFKGRVFDTPIAENALTGFVTGAALAGMRPVLVHMRMDFIPLSFDQILNHAAKFCYMSGGKVRVPLVIRALIGRGWGSAAQHSQSLHALFMHMPGLKVVMPSCAYDAKGLLLASIADNNPVVFIEHRWLYDMRQHVPKNEYLIPIGKGFIRKSGSDATVVALSLMVSEAQKAAGVLKQDGIDIEIIDLRALNPLDEDIVIGSVKKTGRLVIADLGWQSSGAAEILAGRLFNKIRPYLKSGIRTVALPDTPTPCSPVLEDAFYRNATDIVKSVKEMF
ncbi:MAG: transketolase C-terminal domain-containing protein [Candidatus Omnitrophota bacterium]